MTANPNVITSRDNPLLKRLRLLSHDNAAYRKLGQVWLEGDHLCRALLSRGRRPSTAVFTEAFWAQAPHDLRDAADHVVLIPEALMAGISTLESPAGVGFVWDLPKAAGLDLPHSHYTGGSDPVRHLGREPDEFLELPHLRVEGPAERRLQVRGHLHASSHNLAIQSI